MIRKVPLCPQRLRRVPRQFSWIDQRFLRHGYFLVCSKDAIVLYFFLLIVADAEGLSYYADSTIGQRLHLEPMALAKARHELLRWRLIAYQPPLYQVLELMPPDRTHDDDASTAYPGPVCVQRTGRRESHSGCAPPVNAAVVADPERSRSAPPQPLGTILQSLLNPKKGSQP